MAAPLLLRRVLTAQDWAEVVRIRTAVFIDEQACPPEDEWDDHDAPEARFSTCRHFLGNVEDESAAVARWHPCIVDGQPAAKLERFAVLPQARGSGYGKAMVAHLLADARLCGYAQQVLHAQVYLENLYAKFGFVRVGDVFEEAGIPHVKMASMGPL